MKKNIFVVLFLFAASACGFFQEEPVHEFPLTQSWKMETKERIKGIVVSDCQVAIAGPSTLTVIDANTGKENWSRKFFMNPESALVYAGNLLIAASSDKIEIFDKAGQEVAAIDIGQGGGYARVISAFSHYIFVVRTPAWTLEVYDATTKALVWEMRIERDGRVDYDDSANIVYISSAKGIKAINILDGSLIWELPLRVRKSIYNNGVIYIFESTETENTFNISAIDAADRRQIWRTQLHTQLNLEIYSLAIFDKVLIATTQRGLRAYDKTNGQELWQSESEASYYSPPVKIDNLYAKGNTSGIVSSISLRDGYTIGDLQFENSKFVQPYYEYEAGIYTCGNTLIFSNSNTVFAYGKTE